MAKEIKFFKYKSKGFTLIELTVVVSIISLLASIIFVAVNKARASARDVARISTAGQIVKALELYHINHGYYPDSSVFDSSAYDCDGWSISKNPSFLAPLIQDKIITVIPKDPQNNGECAMNSSTNFFTNSLFPNVKAAVEVGPPLRPVGNILAYQYFPAGANGCDVSKGNYYVLGIKNLETVSEGSVHKDSPGFFCSGHNWQDDFKWVTGTFEK